METQSTTGHMNGTAHVTNGKGNGKPPINASAAASEPNRKRRPKVDAGASGATAAPKPRLHKSSPESRMSLSSRRLQLDAVRSKWIPQIEKYRDELAVGLVALEEARMVARMHRRDVHYRYPEMMQQINDETVNEIINGPSNAADGIAHATEALCEALRETDKELRELVEDATFAFFRGLAAMLRRLNLIECFAGGYHDAVTMPAEDVMELLGEISVCLALFKVLRVAE